MKITTQQIYTGGILFVALAYFIAGMLWLTDPLGTSIMSGVPFLSDDTARFYGGIKAIQDMIVPFLLIIFLFTHNWKGVSVGLIIALLIPITDMLFAYLVIGGWDSVLVVHMIYIVLTMIVLFITRIHQSRQHSIASSR